MGSGDRACEAGPWLSATGRTAPGRQHEIAIIGTGIAGRTLALGLQQAGHDVVVGSGPRATGRREEWARGLEMWLPLWVRLMGALETAEFNLEVVR